MFIYAIQAWIDRVNDIHCNPVSLTLDELFMMTSWNGSALWPFVRGIHLSLVDSSHNGGNAELWSFLWCQTGGLTRHDIHVTSSKYCNWICKPKTSMYIILIRTPYLFHHNSFLVKTGLFQVNQINNIAIVVLATTGTRLSTTMILAV